MAELLNDAQREIARMAELLKIEEEEDRRQYTEKVLLTPLAERVKQGSCWYPLRWRDTHLGPGDTLMVTLAPMGQGRPESLNRNSFQPGQVVSLFWDSSGHKRNPSATGVVARVSPEEITIALHGDEEPEWLDNAPLGLDAFYDDRSYREMEAALRVVQRADTGRVADLRAVMLGYSQARFDRPEKRCFAEHLNDSQRQAVDFALSALDGAFLLGPPGTGKTTTLVEAIRLAAQAEGQVLVCAASNTAVDVLAERLSNRGLNVLRLGHPVRVNEQLLSLTLDARIDAHPAQAEWKKLLKLAEQAQAKAAKYKRSFGPAEKRARAEAYTESKLLRKDAERIERYILHDVLGAAQAICCTLTGAAAMMIRDMRFRTVFIDEAAQAMEPANWIPLLKAERVIFAGDPFQLPPTVKSPEAAAAGLSVSLAEKFLQRQSVRDRTVWQMLQVQYRMHADIMAFPNHHFYGDQLKASRSVASRLLPFATPPAAVEYLDTAGCGFDDETSEVTLSTSNPSEAAFVLRHLEAFVAEHLDEILGRNISIGLIAPYGDQVAIFRREVARSPVLSQLGRQLSVRTIDGFQGQERDVIYLSLVRSNASGTIGFLSDTRRMNVALTRAKSRLVVVGDSATLCSHPFYSALIDHFQQAGVYRSAWETGLV